MDRLLTMQKGLDEIRADWQASSLDEKQNYVLELGEMATDAKEMRGVSGEALLHDVDSLRHHIERQIVPAQQKRKRDDAVGERGFSAGYNDVHNQGS